MNFQLFTFNFQLNYKDHLGNNRLSYTFDPKTEQVKILEENHYYPFGLKHGTYNQTRKDVKYKEQAASKKEIKQVVPEAVKFKYLYNGKELQDELGLNIYDYGARVYDPAVPRFWQIDPLAEKYHNQSVYIYADDSPVRFRDIDGKGVDDIIIRARSEADNGAYVPMVVIKTKVDATVDLDLSFKRAPLIDGITGAGKPIEINGQQIDSHADAVGVSLTGSVTIGKGEAVTKGVVLFINGSDKNKVFQYDVDAETVGFEASGTISLDNYFSTGNISSFNRYTLEGTETGIDISGGENSVSIGVTGFAGIDLKKMKIPYIGYSKNISIGEGLPIKGYKSSSTLVREITK